MYGLIEKCARQKNITLTMKWLILSIAFLIAGCGGGSGGGDKTAPTISITSPTSDATYTSTTTPLTIAGVASDNKGVSNVTWSSSAGGSGTCTGTTSWTADIPLTAGLNTITVTAKDKAGNAGVATLAVTTPPAVSITSPTSNATYTSTTTPLTIAGTASDNTGVSTVTWSSSTGDSGTCTGTTSWTADIRLIEGMNTITVTAEDAAGNAGVDTLAVTGTLPKVTLSGTITAPSNTAVDSDVNDTNQTPASNNTIATAQSIPNPVTLGGYVNMAGSGEDGNSYSSGDVDDYFKVSLSEGDSLFLSIADYNSEDTTPVDQDFYVYNSTGAVVASSVGASGSESIANFPSSGIYYVNVHAVSGASNYILSIGIQTAGAAIGALSTDREFVPGQTIVRLKDQGIVIASVQDLSDRTSDMGMNLKAGGPGHEALASFDVSKKAATFKTLGIEDRLSLKAVDEKTQKKLDTLLVIKALRKRSDVESADPNYILHAVNAVPNDANYSMQWNLPLINLPLAWDTTTNINAGSSVIVAVVDTGVLLSHPDLADKLTAGYDFISDAGMSNDNDGIDNNPDDPGDDLTGLSSFHGTHCAGIIAAATNNSIGVAGVGGWSTNSTSSPLIRIMPVRVLGIDGGTEYDVLQGVRYAAGLSNDSGTVPATNADIINLSLGGGSYSSAAQKVYTEVRNAGVIVIAAAGNDSSSTSFYPASYDGVVSVSATDINADQASYSNYGTNIDVAAPGGDSGDLNGDGYPDYVVSTCGDDSSGDIQFTYSLMAGTSMAAPHVSGVVALMKAVKPTLTPVDLDAYLIDGDLTDDIGASGWDEDYGYGLIDAYKAVQAAQGGTVPTVLKISPASLNFGQSSETLTLTASKIGSDTLSVTKVSDDADWLTITPSSDVDEDGLGSYTVKVDRSSFFSSGNYSATITFTTFNSKTVVVPVLMRVNTSGITPDAGVQYVLLINSYTQDTEAQDIVEAGKGIYTYSFSNVPQDTYEIYAGSDRDNDGYIGDAGEAYGAYKSVDQPTDIIADSDISGLDFSTDYLVTLSSAAGVNEGKTNYLMRRIQKVTKQVKLLSK